MTDPTPPQTITYREALNTLVAVRDKLQGPNVDIDELEVDIEKARMAYEAIMTRVTAVKAAIARHTVAS